MGKRIRDIGGWVNKNRGDRRMGERKGGDRRMGKMGKRKGTQGDE